MSNCPRLTPAFSSRPAVATRTDTLRLKWLMATVALGTLGASGVASAQQAPVVLDTVTLEGAGSGGATTSGGLTTEGYVAKAATTATKTDTPLIKVPQSVSVVTREQLDDRNVQNLTQALTYTPGVRVGSAGFDPRFDSFTIRGFDVTYNGVYRDGLRELTGNFSIFKTEPYGLEGLAVLKGPSSAVYGAGSPGGVVDLISKRQVDAPLAEAGVQIGNKNRRQVEFDLGGPIGDSTNVLYRLTGLVRQSDTDMDASRDDRAYIAPALTVRSDDRNTTFTLLGEYSDSKTGGNTVYLNENGAITDLESGDPAYRDFDQEQARVGYEFEHRFNETFTLRQKLRYAHIDADVKYTQIDSITADRLTANRSAWRITDALGSLAVDNQAQANFSTGGIAHTLLGGLDYNYVDVTDRIGFTGAPSLDLSTLNYGEQAIEGPADYNFADGTTKQRQTGLYLQDQMEYERFVLTLGGRYDWLNTRKFDNKGNTPDSEQEDEKFTGRVGLSYLTDFGVAPYISYSTSFAPTIGRAFDGTNFKPTEGEQQEIGVKYVPEGYNASINAALFRITQQNGLTSDPDNLFFQVQRGEIRSQGFELEATAGFDNGFGLIAAYTYMDLEIIEGDNKGNRPSGLPQHQVSLWGDYTVKDGPAEGLGLGAGVRYLGKSYGDDLNSFENEGRVLVDASISYGFKGVDSRLEGLELKVNANNLFDKRNATCQAGYCYREEGRAIIGSLSYKF